MPRQLLSAGRRGRKGSTRKAAKNSGRKNSGRKNSGRKNSGRKKSGKKMQHNEFYSMHEKRRVKTNRFWVKKIQTKLGARYQAVAFDPQDRKLHKFVSKDFYEKHKGRKRM